MRILAAFAMAFIALPCAAQHHDHTAHMQRNELGASAAFDAKGVLWAAYSQPGQIYVRRSADFGVSWDTPVAVAAEAVDGGADARPKIAIGPEAELFVTWTRPLAKPYTGNIRFARSIDGGRTFSAPMTVQHDDQEITHRFDSLTVTRDGKLFVAWVDKRDQRGSKDYRGAAIYYAVSDDRGKSFRGDFRVAEHSCECCRIALLPRPDGSVLAFWRHVFEPNIRDHAIAALRADGRVSGFQRATYDDWRIDVCPHHGGSLGADASGRLHAVWYSGTPGRAGAYYGRPGGDGVEGQRRIGGETAEHPDLAVDGDRVVVAWKEFDGERTQLKAAISPDAGRAWSERQVAATAAASDQPRLLVHDRRFYVFWNTREKPLRVEVLR